MSGHSKWKTIAHKKGAADAKRGKIFSKISKELMVVARQGGGDQEKNPALRTVVRKARAANMPADNIQRAIKKGTGELEGGQLEEMTYEGFAPGGVAVVASVLTDNKNRAVSEIRHIFTKHSANLASQGAVSRGFKRKGQIIIDAATISEDKLMDIVLEAGAEDMQRDGDEFEVLTEPADFDAVSDALEKAEIKTLNAEILLLADNYLPVTEQSVAASLLRFLNELEDQDDIQNVYTNMDIDEELLKKIRPE